MFIAKIIFTKEIKKKSRSQVKSKFLEFLNPRILESFVTKSPVLFLFFVLFISYNPLLAAEKKEYIIGVHFPSGAAGLSSSETYNLANSALNVVIEETGFKARFERFSSMEDVLNAFIKGKIDGAPFGVNEIIKILEKGVEVYYLAIPIFNNQRKVARCFWFPKDAPIKDISELFGKTIIDIDFRSFGRIQMRELLSKNGIDKPLWQVFKSFIIVPSSNSAYIALVMKRADIMWSPDIVGLSMKIMNPAVASKLTYNFCTERKFSSGAFVLNKKTVSKTDYNKLRENIQRVESLINEYAKKEQAILQLKQYMKIGKAKIVPADEDEFAVEWELYQKAKANGWLKEAEYIAGVLSKASPGQPVEIKPDYEYCKSECPDKKTMLKCIEKCLGE